MAVDRLMDRQRARRMLISGRLDFLGRLQSARTSFEFETGSVLSLLGIQQLASLDFVRLPGVPDSVPDRCDIRLNAIFFGFR